MLINELTRGIIIRNPVFVAAVGLCPALAVTTTARAGFDLGVATLAVLLIVNILVSLTRRIISVKSRLPVVLAFAALAASLVSLAIRTWIPFVDNELGIFLPLTAVNCLILERADSFARNNRVPRAMLDAAVIGLGYIGALLLIGSIRELFGSGTLFGFGGIPFYRPVATLGLAPGGFIVLALIIAAGTAIRNRKNKGDAA